MLVSQEAVPLLRPFEAYMLIYHNYRIFLAKGEERLSRLIITTTLKVSFFHVEPSNTESAVLTGASAFLVNSGRLRIS